MRKLHFTKQHVGLFLMLTPFCSAIGYFYLLSPADFWYAVTSIGTVTAFVLVVMGGMMLFLNE
jgi:hypothetical protein